MGSSCFSGCPTFQRKHEIPSEQANDAMGPVGGNARQNPDHLPNRVAQESISPPEKKDWEQPRARWRSGHACRLLPHLCEAPRQRAETHSPALGSSPARLWTRGITLRLGPRGFRSQSRNLGRAPCGYPNYTGGTMIPSGELFFDLLVFLVLASPSPVSCRVSLCLTSSVTCLAV